MRSPRRICTEATVCINVRYPKNALQNYDEELGSALHAATFHEKSI
jgi:hypothetical protein